MDDEQMKLAEALELLAAVDFSALADPTLFDKVPWAELEAVAKPADEAEPLARECLVLAMELAPNVDDRRQARYVKESAGAYVSAATAIKAMLAFRNTNN